MDTPISMRELSLISRRLWGPGVAELPYLVMVALARKLFSVQYRRSRVTVLNRRHFVFDNYPVHAVGSFQLWTAGLALYTPCRLLPASIMEYFFASTAAGLCSCSDHRDLTWLEVQAESVTVQPFLDQFPGLTLLPAYLRRARQAKIARIDRDILCNANRFLW